MDRIAVPAVLQIKHKAVVTISFLCHCAELEQSVLFSSALLFKKQRQFYYLSSVLYSTSI